MSPFFATSMLTLGALGLGWQAIGAQSLIFLKICAILAVLSGLAYAPQDSFVSPGAFSEFFGNTNVVRAMATSLMFVGLFSKKLPSVPFYHKTITILFAFPLYMAMISAASGEPIFTKGFFGLMLRLLDVICFFTFGFWLSIHKKAHEFVHFMTSLALIVVLLSIAALVLEPESATRAARFRGVSFSVNWSGMYLALLIVPVFSMLIEKRQLVIRTIVAALFITLLLFLLATGSRGAVLSSLFGLLTFSLVSRINFTVTAIVGAFSLLILFLLPTEYGVLDSQSFMTRMQTVENTRATVWQEGWNQWLQSETILIGTLNASDAVESQVLSILYVYGVLGSAVAIICLLFIFNEIRKARIGKPSEASNVALAMVTVFFVTCLFETPYFGIISSFNIFLYIAIGVILGDKATRRRMRET